MVVVTSAFNEAIALKKRKRERRDERKEKVKERQTEKRSMSKTHFLVYELKTSRLIVQALIQFRMLIVISRTRVRSLAWFTSVLSILQSAAKIFFSDDGYNVIV